MSYHFTAKKLFRPEIVKSNHRLKILIDTRTTCRHCCFFCSIVEDERRARRKIHIDTKTNVVIAIWRGGFRFECVHFY